MEFKSKTVFVFGLTAVISLLVIISDTRFSAQNLIPVSPLAEHLKERKKQLLPDEQQGKQVYINGSFEPESNSTADKRIYISMGLCWSQHTSLYKKFNFPYEEAARMAPKLWKKFGNVTVILQIVYVGRMSPELKSFVQSLIADDVLVRTVPAGSMDCILKSQLVRLFATDMVLDEQDLIVTSDVDAFPMSSSLLQPLFSKNYKIWIYEYITTIRLGYTFAMSFLAMSKQLWTKLLRVSSPELLVKLYEKPLNLTSTSPWFYDQLIVSRIILESGLCSLPANNTLWKTIHLPPAELDGKDTCFYGTDYGNCDKENLERENGCKWWHFHPDERKSELQKKFKQIYFDEPPPTKVQTYLDTLNVEIMKILGLRT